MIKFKDLVQLVNPGLIFIIYLNQDKENFIMKYAEEIINSDLEDYIVTYLENSPYGIEIHLKN